MYHYTGEHCVRSHLIEKEQQGVKRHLELRGHPHEGGANRLDLAIPLSSRVFERSYQSTSTKCRFPSMVSDIFP